MNKPKVLFGLIVIVFLLSAVLIGYFYVSKKDSEKRIQKMQLEEESASPSAEIALPAQPTEFKIMVGVQKEGRALLVDYLEATESGWIGVASDEGGKPAQVVEEAIPRFERGSTAGEFFVLSEPLASGKNYWVIVYKESGEEALNLQGAPVRQLFEVK